MKKVGIKGLGATLVSLAALGAAGPASADVYGLGRLDISNLSTEFGNLATGGTAVQSWNFSTGATASLNGSGTGTSAVCNGFGVGAAGNCDNGAGGLTVLSGPVQNAPGSNPLRSDDDFSVFGQGTEYSGAESSIIDAQIVGDGSTAVSLIAESNLVSGVNGAASSNVGSGTSLNFDFLIDDSGEGAGEFAINFNADWAAVADITGTSEGSATGAISASARLQSENGTLIEWVPNGAGGIIACVGGVNIDCSSTEAGTLNFTASSGENGSRDEESGSGMFSLAITGLESGTYSFSLTAADQSIVSQEVPAPATLLLLGAGLLAGAGTYRRRRAA